ncbi:MAG: hypothetical protein ABIY52_10755, partial [Gemmatimonadaceae bacterium]
MTISSSLPPLYAAWMDDLLRSPIPPESNATCASCAMVTDEPGEVSYNVNTKCCTFLPDIWNFLAGAVLLDEHPDAARGRATIEARIGRGVGVTPLGLRRTQAYRLLYANSPASFGRSRTLLCPHYIDEAGGLCGVWRHRESTCTTWFCKFVRGAVGREFWTQLHQLLRAAEESVSAWCLMELGVEHAVMTRLFRPFASERPANITDRDLDGIPDSADLDALWGSWRGRERELYVECARLVAPLSWTDVSRIGGAQLAVYARLVQVAHARLLDDAAPEHPVTAMVQITPRSGSLARLATYSGSDTLEVPSVVAAMLPSFDGRPLADAIAGIRAEHGVVV